MRPDRCERGRRLAREAAAMIRRTTPGGPLLPVPAARSVQHLQLSERRLFVRWIGAKIVTLAADLSRVLGLLLPAFARSMKAPAVTSAGPFTFADEQTAETAPTDAENDGDGYCKVTVQVSDGVDQDAAGLVVTLYGWKAHYRIRRRIDQSPTRPPGNGIAKSPPEYKALVGKPTMVVRPVARRGGYAT